MRGPDGADSAQRRPPARRPRRPQQAPHLLRDPGPGLISAAADNDAGGITTWSVIGARYGYSMLWLLLLITPILAVTQEMGARMGAVTGKGLAALIREKFSLRVTAFAMLALLIANFGTTTAEFSGIAAAFSLAHIPASAAVPPVAFGVWLLVTRGTLPQGGAGLPRPDRGVRRLRHRRLPGEARLGKRRPRHVVPQVQTNSLWILTAIAAVGTTITPWGQFFIQAYIVDKTRLDRAVRLHEAARSTSGAVFTDAIDLFIVLACAATLYRKASSSRRLRTPPRRWRRSRARPRTTSSASGC